MAEIENKKTYLIEHPRTGKPVEWSGDRIKAYQVVHRTDLVFVEPEPPKKKRRKKKIEEPIKESDNGN